MAVTARLDGRFLPSKRAVTVLPVICSGGFLTKN